jgi:hypothetical protein
MVIALEKTMEILWIDESGYIGIIPPALLIEGIVEVVPVCQVWRLAFLRGRFGGFHRSL